MSNRLIVQQSVSGLVTLAGSRAVTDDAAEIAAPASVAAAIPGTLSTRVSNTSGTLSMPAGHGIVTGQRLDLYWPGGSCYGVTAGTVVTNTVPFSAVVGGDNLPPQGTAITVGIISTVAFSITGANMTALCLSDGQGFRARWVFRDAATTPLEQPFLVAAGEVFVWAGSGTNPMTISPVEVKVSHEDTGAVKTGMLAAALRH